MSGNLGEFLVDLASDPDQMAAFLADPDRVLDAAGLSGEERDAVRSRDARRLSAVLNPGLHLEANNNNLTIKTPAKPTRKAPARKKGGRKKKGGTRKGGRKGGTKKR